MQVFILFFGVFFIADDAFAAHAGGNCMGCHATGDIMPGVYQQYSKSAHFKNNVTCFDCHGAKKSDKDAFEHKGAFISIVVSPKDCKKCHAAAVHEFNASAHYKARRLISTGAGAYFLKHFAGSQHLPHHPAAGKYAAGINGCLRCHGSEIKIGKGGHPTAETWPNSGIGRKNPDGSIGNCAACHQRHEFSVAQARQPESCAICHNSAGGEPQIKVYNTSRHGTIYHTMMDQMHLHSDKWVVGRDYSAAPTCATCHMSATKEMAVTHNINARLDWNAFLQETNTLAIMEKCGFDIQKKAYKQPTPNPKHEKNMKKVCIACHSETLVNNFMRQYEMEVRLVKEKWLEPGKKLFHLATNVLKSAHKNNASGKNYQLFTHSIDFTWFNMCNVLAKKAHSGAAMMSPGMVEQANAGFAASWYSGYMPQIKEIIEQYKDSDKGAVKALQKYYKKIKTNPVYSGPWKDKKRPTPE